MSFFIRNVFIISMTAFIFFDTTNFVETVTYNTSLLTEVAPAPVVNWHIVKSGTKNFYIQKYFKANWYKSMEYCHFHGMRFASINNDDEHQDLIYEMMESNFFGGSHFWISGNDLSKNKSFVWLGNGQTFRYENWLIDEPSDNPGEDCVEYWFKEDEGFKWNDEKCNLEYFFICEF